MKFNIGDRVKVIENANEHSVGIFYNVGDTGTSIHIEDDSIENLEVQFDEGSLNTDDTWWIMGANVKLNKEES